MKLLEPTQKFIGVFSDGLVAKNHKFWFNLDLSFIATSDGTDENKRANWKHYATEFQIDLTYEDLIERFNVPFITFINEFKDVPEIYKSFDFKE